MSAGLERRAELWLQAWPNARHLRRTRDWLLELAPGAGLALRLAALTHDAERNFPGSPAQPADRRASDREYRDAHQTRSAEVVREWLVSEGAAPELASEVSALIRIHEWGGTPDADLLQAADSISFLEVNADHASLWMVDHGHSRARIADQFEWMYSRIALARARELAGPFYERACAIIAELQGRSHAGQPGDLPGS